MDDFLSSFYSSLGVLCGIVFFIVSSILFAKVLSKTLKAKKKATILSPNISKAYVEALDTYLQEAKDNEDYTTLSDPNLPVLRESLLNDRCVPVDLEDRYEFTVDPVQNVYNVLAGKSIVATLTVKPSKKSK